MDNNFSELQFKYELATGKDYSQIRSLQLNQIIALSNTQIEPQIIKGIVPDCHHGPLLRRARRGQ